VQQMLNVWQGLDARRKVIVAGATIAMFAAVMAMTGVAGKPTMGLLYAGLDGSRAGDVVAALDQRGVTYEVRGDSIYVPVNDRDALRMSLAGEGLPANGGAGYELLDGLSGFGTTSQMFDAAYWRAKEGELARTIVASAHIREARVHIAAASGQPFRRDQRPTASVTVTSATGGLTPAQAKALKYLVASAVAGMHAEDVSVIDRESGLVMTGEETPMIGSADERAAELKRNVERLLEAHVGFGKAVVEVAVDTVTEREAIVERRFDPESRVAISTEIEERSNSSTDSRSGSVTVASNLPAGDAAGGEGNRSQSQDSETLERTNYEVSETKREVLRTPGAIRRITVAVLVDAVETIADDGTPAVTPRTEEELSALRDLVASAVGFDEARGDVITIKSLPFEPVPDLGTEPVAASILPPMDFDVMQLIQTAVLAVVALVLGLFVLRPLLTSGAGAPRNAEQPAAQPPALAGNDGPPALTGEIDEGDFMPQMNTVSDFDLGGAPGELPQMSMGMGDFGGMGGSDDSDPVNRLKKLIEERQDESVEILKGWMQGEGEKA